MKEAIRSNLNNPRQLEQLYREDKAAFKIAFDVLYPDIQQHTVAQIWYERLHFGQEKISWGAKNELILVVLLAVVAGMIAKIPGWLQVDEEYFYSRHIGFIFLPLLMAYFVWQRKPASSGILPAVLALSFSIIYMNLLPNDTTSDTLTLACIHMPLFMWSLLGYSFTIGNIRNLSKRVDFLKYNGDLVIITTIILIAGGILSAVTVGLFDLIGMDIADFYFSNFAVWGLSAAPIVGTYLVQTNPQLVKNVSPIIARIFTPLVLIMLVAYLAAMIYTGKDPYNDRDFLIIFNLLLIGVMAIILFAVAETAKNTAAKWNILLLFILSVVTIFVNMIALSAIIFRISEWGITPNRLAVLGGNLLILSNLLVVAYRLMKSVKSTEELTGVENSIAAFLPIYSLWTVVVIFVFPALFGFK